MLTIRQATSFLCRHPWDLSLVDIYRVDKKNKPFVIIVLMFYNYLMFDFAGSAGGRN